jgi:hypothetical protein
MGEGTLEIRDGFGEKLQIRLILTVLGKASVVSLSRSFSLFCPFHGNPLILNSLLNPLFNEKRARPGLLIEGFASGVGLVVLMRDELSHDPDHFSPCNLTSNHG